MNQIINKISIVEKKLERQKGIGMFQDGLRGVICYKGQEEILTPLCMCLSAKAEPL